MKFKPDDAFLIRLKQAGRSDQFISERLHISLEEVVARWTSIQEILSTIEANGYSRWVEALGNVAGTYQVLGERMSSLFSGVGEPVPVEEVEEVLKECPQNPAQTLCRRFMILRPFKSPEDLPPSLKN